MNSYGLVFDENVVFPTRINLKVSAENLPEAKEVAKKWIEENKDAIRAKQDKEHIYNVGDPLAWRDDQEGIFVGAPCVDPDFVIEGPKTKKAKTYTIMYYDGTGKTISSPFGMGIAHCLTWTKVTPANLPDILNGIANRATRAGGVLIPETKSPFLFMRKYGNDLGLIPKGALSYAINNPDDVTFISFSVGYPDEV